MAIEIQNDNEFDPAQTLEAMSADPINAGLDGVDLEYWRQASDSIIVNSSRYKQEYLKQSINS